MKNTKFKIDFKHHDAENLATVLAAHNHLKIVNFSFSVDVCNAFCEILSTSETILTLHIDREVISSDCGSKLFNSLKLNKSVESLRLTKCNINPAQAQEIAALMMSNNTIREYDLSVNYIKDQGSEHIACALRENIALTSLNLSLNDIEEQGLLQITKALSFNSNITQINLSKNKPSLYFQQALLKVLNNHSSLTSIDIGFIINTETFYSSALSCVKNNKKIFDFKAYRYLNFSGDEEIRKELDQALIDNKFYISLASVLFNKKYDCNQLKTYQKVDKTILAEYLLSNYGIYSVKEFYDSIDLYIASNWQTLLGICKTLSFFQSDIWYNIGTALGDQSLHCIGTTSHIEQESHSCAIM